MIHLPTSSSLTRNTSWRRRESPAAVKSRKQFPRGSLCFPKYLTALTTVFVCLTGIVLAATDAPPQGAAATGRYRNLFAEFLGKTESETDAKIQAAWDQLFSGDLTYERLYYPIADDMAYIPDVANRDIRTEGLSYGMMICVQLNHQKEFDALWKFAKKYMYRNTGPLRGFFTWHVSREGFKIRDSGPAPDGEEWFTMALFFASHRWGNGEGIFNYEAEAQALLRAMLHKAEMTDHGKVGNMFDRTAKQIVFVPQGPGAQFTDASYHLPAYYELWARWADSADDRAFMAEAARTSRELFKKTAHPTTGLMPNFSHFDGSLVGMRGGMADEFREDAWRTLANPALDYSWWAADTWEIEEANRQLAFFSKQPANGPDHYKIDGTPTRTDEVSPGLYSIVAVAGLAGDPALAKPFVQRLWDRHMPDDHDRNRDGNRKSGELRSQRYYDGLLTMLSLLQVSGHFRIYAPPTQAAP